MATLRFANLRKACAAALVPLNDAAGWALPDEQVVLAVEAARDGVRSADGFEALRLAVAEGELLLGSRHHLGRPSFSELLTLASVLRSPVADEVMAL
jgi:hypothetical protein